MPYNPPKHDPNDSRLPGMPLQEWMDRNGVNSKMLAEMIPCAANYPGLIAKGVQQPSYKMACRIEEITSGEVPRTRYYPSQDLDLSLPMSTNQDEVPDV